ncbi:hypothetical protein PF003_g28465 [Phytophthora fragariae]|nr:hypothetical protein PF003_g28465 [Phytophthora fragariae]
MRVSLRANPGFWLPNRPLILLILLFEGVQPGVQSSNRRQLSRVTRVLVGARCCCCVAC